MVRALFANLPAAHEGAAKMRLGFLTTAFFSETLPFEYARNGCNRRSGDSGQTPAKIVLKMRTIFLLLVPLGLRAVLVHSNGPSVGGRGLQELKKKVAGISTDGDKAKEKDLPSKKCFWDGECSVKSGERCMPPPANKKTGQSRLGLASAGICTKVNASCPLKLTNFHVSAKPPAQVLTSFSLADCNGKPVASDVRFRVEEDGEWDSNENSWYLLQNATSKSFVMFLVDMSASARESLVEALPTITTISLQLCREGVECALYAFDGRKEPQKLIDFSNKKFSETVATAIIRYETEDRSTNLYGVIKHCVDVLMARLKREASKEETTVQAAALILFSDGKDLARRSSRSAAIKAVNDGRGPITFFSVAVPPKPGSRSDEDFLYAFAGGKDSGAIYRPKDERDLKKQFEQLFSDLYDLTNSFYVIGFCSALRNDETHKVNVTAYRGGLAGYAHGDFSSSGFKGGCSETLLRDDAQGARPRSPNSSKKRKKGKKRRMQRREARPPVQKGLVYNSSLYAMVMMVAVLCVAVAVAWLVLRGGKDNTRVADQGANVGA
ncbi:unnamed protein product [Vitrella brassicaformis CCMP3155]|uniref:VWFA domain-containing protein n=2 Tax=Vitrella brassicaformis TaxID=1169539 RepID=A0A0G4EY76_VITBC|nr:unnamed protein product [Vitrella brassicaformis CCMP3155]|eukprot:CEM04080.1 unnamed protein product [Vitrella brassicaformis CCMP3155]